MNGKELLEIWLRESELSQARAARRFGVCESSVSKYLKGTRKPGLRIGLEIERVTHGVVSASSWGRK